MQILGGTAKIGPEMLGQVQHRQLREDFLAKQAGPGTFQDPAPLGA
jgi:hypothetical protein